MVFLLIFINKYFGFELKFYPKKWSFSKLKFLSLSKGEEWKYTQGDVVWKMKELKIDST